MEGVLDRARRLAVGRLESLHRNRWIGWAPNLRYQRPHLFANNTRFVILGAKGSFPGLASLALGAMKRRLSDDRLARQGIRSRPRRRLSIRGILTERSARPPTGAISATRAATLATTAATPTPTERPRSLRHSAAPRRLPAASLAEAAARLGTEEALPAGLWPNAPACEELARVEDFRRPQGRKHSAASTPAVVILALLPNQRGPVAAAERAKQLSQRELESIGAWRNPRTGKREPVSKSTLHRVLSSVDSGQIEAVLNRFSMPRLQLGRAIAIDGKRVRGASRHGSDHCEVATMVDHKTRAARKPGVRDKGGEIAAVRSLLEEVPVAGRAPPSMLAATRDTARVICETRKADCLFTVKENAPETCAALASIDWEKSATGTFEEPIDKAHGRIEQRRIEVMTLPPGTINCPGVAQVFRITRVRIDARRSGAGSHSEERACGITSAPEERASPEELLARNRGHWLVEANQHVRDRVFAEDACLSRTGFGPANNALCNNLAIAIIPARRSSRASPRRPPLRAQAQGRLQGHADALTRALPLIRLRSARVSEHPPRSAGRKLGIAAEDRLRHLRRAQRSPLRGSIAHTPTLEISAPGSESPEFP